MKLHTFRLVPALLVPLLMIAALPVLAQSVYPGNGNSDFDSNFLTGSSLTVSNDGPGFGPGTGFVDFTITLAGANTIAGLQTGNNNIVIYLDNGKGGGITSTAPSTFVTSGTFDGGEQAVSENNGAGSASNLNFGGLMAPQYAIEIDQFNFGQIYSDTGGVPTFIDGDSSGNTTGAGLSYLVIGGTASVNIPISEFGLTAPGTITLASLEVSATGYSSNEGTESLIGTNGYGNTQTLTGVDTFAVVPEGSSIGLLLSGGIGVLLMRKRYGRR